MTLRRQLILFLSTLFLVVYAGTLAIGIRSTRAYLIDQMQSHAQDTATSLGLSLAPALAANDLTLAETMISAIFDPGYYREITLRAADGSIAVERRLPVRVEGVPGWFVNLVPLGTPMRESEITTGWRRAGTISVRSHPGYAYRDLWRIAVRTAWWFLGVVGGAIVVVAVGLRYLLAPLRDVERQAETIAQREFPTNDRVPRTRELRRVVLAMNAMSGKLKRWVSDQTELTEQVREEAYRDPVTGLPNRRGFDARLRTFVESKEEYQNGALLLLELKGLAAYNDRHGYAAGDELLRQTAELLTGAASDYPQAFVARVGGATLGALVPDLLPDETRRLAEHASHRLGELVARGVPETDDAAAIGAAVYDGRLSATQLLAQADMALRSAQTAGPNAWRVYLVGDLGETGMHGAQEWRVILANHIAERNVILHGQPVVSLRDRTALHHEVFARLPRPGGRLLPAGVFLPMAERVGLSQAFDRLVVEMAIDRIGAEPGNTVPLAINLSPASAHDPAFLDWLGRTLNRLPRMGTGLIFELPEYQLLANREAAYTFVARVHELKGQVSLDHFGAGFRAFGYLQGLKPDCIKIDGSYIRNLDTNADNRFFVGALTEIAHGLDILVVAQSVETDAEWRALESVHVDGAQGYHISAPMPWDSK
jgi:diguanylate cyclase (GGDEF)-like protein